MKLKVAALQFDAALGRREDNMAKADGLLASVTQADGLDLLVLPEMAFTGYHFADRESIRPLVEGEGGPTEQWCRRHARRLRCTVFCGYPALGDALDGEPAPYHNSMLVVGPDGEVMERYHKHFLYVTDETWATAGDGFRCVTLPNGVKVGLGICMDINPYKFEAPWDAFELANHCLRENVQVLAFSSNWCTAHPDDTPATKAAPPDEDGTLNYWASRLKPLFGRDVYFVAADRVGQETLAPIGREGVTTFCGCSCVLSMRKPSLVGNLGTKEEGLLVETISVAVPAATAARRPERKLVGATV